MPHALRSPIEALWGLVPDPLRAALPGSREARACPGGVRIDLRRIGGPGTGRMARRLEDRLLSVKGIDRAEVNGVLGWVFVGCDSAAADLGRLLSIVEQFDGGAGEEEFEPGPVEEAETTEDRCPRSPSSRLAENHARAGLRLGASLLGAGLAVAGRVLRTPPLPPSVPTILNLVDSTPFVRTALERRLGRAVTDTLFTTAGIVGHTFALRPFGMVVQSVTAAARYAETRGTLRAWREHEKELANREGGYRHIRSARTPRTAPMAHSPVDRFERAASPLAVGVSGLTRLLSGSREQGLAMLVNATPKAAKLGREAFAGAVGRAAAGRGAIVLRGNALRRMDGVDTVILDAGVLATGSWTIDRVVPLTGDATGGADSDTDSDTDGGTDGGTDGDELRARLYGLIDLSDPAARCEHDGWTAEPLADPAGFLPAGGPPPPDDLGEWESRGLRAVGVRREGVPVALVGVAPGVDPLADALVAAARGAGTVLLAGGRAKRPEHAGRPKHAGAAEPAELAELARRLGVAESVPGGSGLAARVRALQADGHGVAVVSDRPLAALAQADLGVGVLRPSGPVPWDADVICEPGEAHLLLSSLGPARRTSERCVWLGAATALLGTGLTFLGPRAATVRWAQLVSDGTALVAIAVGEWSGRDAGRVAAPVRTDPTPWHAMRAEDVLARLGSSPRGLSEAEALRRRTASGARPEAPASLLRASAEELANPLTPVLTAGAGLSALVGSVPDAVLIAAVMVIDAFIGGGQRFAADRSLRRLTETVALRVRLRRPGGQESTTVENLVPGDVVELRAGDAVPADCRVVRAVGLEVDEASLTGESQLVAKSPAPVGASALAERTSMVYEGTTVAAGHGLAVVVAAGRTTEAARTAGITAERPPPTGVQLRLRRLSREILPAAIGSGLLLLVADLVRGRPAAQALAPAVSLAVAAVPEGLPFVASVAELAAARRLSRRNTLVPNPSTIEALGRVNVLCFDKTGTLTEGRINLRRVSDGRTEQPVEALTPELRRIVAAGMRAGPRSDPGRPVAHPTDRAVLEGARRLEVTPEDGAEGWVRIDELPFEPGRGYHAVLGAGGAGALLSVKGAPEIVITRCTAVLRDGRETPMTDPVRAELEKEVNRLALQGYRVLAVAERGASDRRDLDEERIRELRFLGFLCLADPIRPTAAESVRRLMGAGVRIVMVTGDHPSTAEAIAAELDALNGGRVMTGPEIDDLDDEELAEALSDAAVLARTTPAHKARIVRCLRRSGKVVAVTGDGANDAPAIRVADVGIALGSRATAAARAAADVVVTDDRIETIVDAIIEGRAMWSSVRDALSVLLGGNIGEIVFTVGSSLLSGRNVLNARQLLLVNLLTDMLPALAVAVRPPAATSPEKLLAEGPEASLGASLTRDIYLRAVTTASAAGAAWWIGRMTGTAGRANTMGLVALVSAQLFQTLALGRRDRVVLLASAVSLAVLGLAVSAPGVSRFFGSRPLGPVGWTVALGSAVAATVVEAALQASARKVSSPVHPQVT
ncbi:HAD-IC family P-type ATPase [Streptosporangium sp. NPDC048047]|uniref:cation-translocating P-type ATPase n=1 Tax=Streptosporangium sp. NPDC048047 TaxID=3155748 RepID=UPI00343CE184